MGFTEFLRYGQLKPKTRVFLLGFPTAKVTYYVTIMIASCSAIIAVSLWYGHDFAVALSKECLFKVFNPLTPKVGLNPPYLVFYSVKCQTILLVNGVHRTPGSHRAKLVRATLTNAMIVLALASLSSLLN